MIQVPVYISCSTSYEPVLARALASWRRLPGLTADVKLDKFVLDPPNEGKVFKTAVWYACLLHKCEYFLQAMQTINDPDIVSVFADADIQVFQALSRHWQALVEDMQTRDLDCLFMREGAGTEVNGGLLVARATPRMQAFWQTIVTQFQQDRMVDMGEQTLINRLLGTSDLRWDYLAADKVVWGAVLPAEELGMRDLCFHHAVCVDGITAKGTQMDRVGTKVLAVQRAAGEGGCEHSGYDGPGDYAHIVLCRYNEDVGCLQNWLGYAGCKVFVYDRGVQPWTNVPSGITHIICENLGREGYVFVQHILTHYASLPEVIIFSQADARESLSNMSVERLLNVRHFGAVCHNVGQGFLLATRWCQGENQGLGYIQYPVNSRWWQAWREGTMTHAKHSIGEYYQKYIDSQLPPVNRCVTTLTGTFAAGREVVRERSVEFYARLQSTLGHCSDPEAGHYLERLWAHIMLGPHAALCVRNGVILS